MDTIQAEKVVNELESIVGELKTLNARMTQLCQCISDLSWDLKTNKI